MAKNTGQSLMTMREEHVPRGPYNLTPIFVENAKGTTIVDIDGKRYLDFAGGIGVQNLGHCADEIVEAVCDQARKFTHTCFHVSMYEAYLKLAKRLNDLTPGEMQKKSFFVNSGAEAVENAVKIARYASGRQAVVCFQNAFHGRTYMGLSLTSQVRPYKAGFEPFCPEVYRMPYAYCYRCNFGLTYPGCEVYCAGYMEEFFVHSVSPDSVAAVILEPVQGEGGFIVPPAEYLSKIRSICDKYEIILIIDEIQSGMGRTGKLFASEHFDVIPDILLTGKSLGAGLPLAGITGKAEIMDKPPEGGLGGTYCGNPLACRAALAVLDLLDDEMLMRARALGEKTRAFFLHLQDRFEIIGDVRGLGAMVGMELVKDRETKEPAREETRALVKSCLEGGLIILSCGSYQNVIRTLIPFIITDEDLERGFSILENCLEKVTKQST
ncbi:MAG: 4-aminobutyrate--2-oxoglutarate transaminase [Deltaproteobacteria bacterium]|nr:4-aminobutyrate--2-oxoglutarate transaminase [Deltaproteobacteria bacterium]